MIFGPLHNSNSKIKFVTQSFSNSLKWREFPRFITFESSDSNKRGEVVMVLFLAGMSEGLKI